VSRAACGYDPDVDSTCFENGDQVIASFSYSEVRNIVLFKY